MNLGVPLEFGELQQRTGFLPLRRLRLAEKSAAGETFDEPFLQRMINEAPAIIPVRDYFPASRQLVSLGREIPVDVGGGKIRSLDNLFVTTDGRLVFVEAKLWRNPEALRAVVAQALEYARVLTSQKLTEIDVATRSCPSAYRVLREGESIEDYLARLNEAEALDGYDPNTFGSHLEHNLKTGEVLLLILGDGIHPSVERFVDWFEKRASMPLSFGLVQIQVFQNPETGKYLALPQSLLKTKEVTRHVVVVDINAPSGVTANVKVSSTGIGESNIQRVELRPRVLEDKKITLSELLSQVKAKAGGMETEVEQFVQGLEGIGLVPLPTKTSIAYALVPEDEEQPIRLVSIYADKIYAGWVASSLKNIGLDAGLAIEFRKDLNQVSRFWRDVGQPGNVSDKSGVGAPLTDLKSKLPKVLELVRKHAAKILAASHGE